MDNSDIKEFSGIIEPTVILSNNSELKIIFSSDSFGVKKGFKIEVKYVIAG